MLDTLQSWEVDLDQLRAVVTRLRPMLSAEEYRPLENAVGALGYLEALVADQTVTMAELRRLIVVRGGTEKTAEVLRRIEREAQAPRPTSPAAPAAAAYTGARRIAVPHETLRPGDRCPECGRGHVYAQREPKWQIRFLGPAPSRPPCTSGSAYGATPATRCSPRPRRPAWARTRMIPPR